MTEQLDLPLNRRRAECSVNDEAILTFVGRLEVTGRWVSARELKADGYSERTARALAAASHGAVISGQEGYKATSCATDEEIHHAAAWLRSQARKMLERADQIEEAA